MKPTTLLIIIALVIAACGGGGPIVLDAIETVCACSSDERVTAAPTPKTVGVSHE